MYALVIASVCVAVLLSAVTWWGVPRKLQSADPVWRTGKVDRWLAWHERRLSPGDRDRVRDGVLRGATLPDGGLRHAAFRLASALMDRKVRLASARTAAVCALNIVLAIIYTCITLTVSHQHPVWPFTVLGGFWLGGAAITIRTSRPRLRQIWQARADNAPEYREPRPLNQIYGPLIDRTPKRSSGDRRYRPPSGNDSPLRTASY